MKHVFKVNLFILILLFSTNDSSAQSTSKKPPIDMAKVKKNRDHVRQKVEEQQSQLGYFQNDLVMPLQSQVPAKDSLPMLRNRKAVIPSKEK